MSRQERERLLDAQKRAMDVLAAASAKAEQVKSEAEAEAVALMLEEQKRAESLIQQAQTEATEHEHSEEEARALLESHRTAADVLSATEQTLAAKLSETKTNAAVDALMAGHREAAAILLDAWMQVAEGRPPAGER